MLEHLADILNLAAKPDYVSQMHFDVTRSNLLLYKERLKDPCVQADPVTLKKFADLKAMSETIKKNLEGQGYKKQSIEQKCKSAGIQELYDIPYRVLSRFTHGQGRYVVSGVGGVGDERASQPHPDNFREFLSIATRLQALAINTLPQFSGLSKGMWRRS